MIAPEVVSVYSYPVEDAHLKGQRLTSQRAWVHPQLRHHVTCHYYLVKVHKKTGLRSPQCLPELS